VIPLLADPLSAMSRNSKSVAALPPGLRVAVVHDWLYTVGGAERVLAAMLRCLPDADLFCLFDMLQPADRAKMGITRPSTTSFLQRMPFIRRRHRMYLPLMPIAIEQLDLSDYDLVISSSHAVAKGVLTGPTQLHLSYVHSPMRYAWDLQHQYLRETGVTRGIKGAMARTLLHLMRLWDVRTAHGPDAYMANSAFVAWRIRKVYGRDAAVIHAPVRVPPACPRVAKQRFFLTASRLVPYKNVQLLVEAFRQLPDETLVVVGTGPELARLQAMAGSNVTFLGYRPDAELLDLMAKARAFLFASEEDFGIVPLEAQAQGTPVIALGRGGVRETILTSGPSPTGLFFDQATPEAVAEAVRRFDRMDPAISSEACHRNAQRFAEDRFEESFVGFVRANYAAFHARMDQAEAKVLPLARTREGAPNLVC
jgi:glycosyltransferase involved in cell wall biosynthesis